MPRGLINQTEPLDCSLPRICEGSLPRTRLTSTELVPGWLIDTRSLAAIEKLDQFSPAVKLVCLMLSWVALVCSTVAFPNAGTAPRGKPIDADAQMARQAAMTGRRAKRPKERRDDSILDMGFTRVVAYKGLMLVFVVQLNNLLTDRNSRGLRTRVSLRGVPETGVARLKRTA